MYARHADKARASARSRYTFKQEQLKAKRRAWRAAHREESRSQVATWRRLNPIYTTVANHYRSILAGKNPAYSGMPFFGAWNPKAGGSFDAGVKWIGDNLGPRPNRNFQLHIVDRRPGFVPGNLQWVPRDKHIQEEMVNRLLLENQNLRHENETLRKNHA